MATIFQRCLLTIISILSITFVTIAQSKEEVKYKKESEEIRKQVWAWNKPEFKVREIPAEYTASSKVILAHHTELTADSKSKLAYYGLGFGVKKEQTISEIVRVMIKLNDKKAVEDYSELSFTRFEKSSGFYNNEKTTAFVGVRIIKPGGKVKELDADEMVLTKNESNEKKAKLAIADLEPGDIIDYFFATEQMVTNDFRPKEYRVFLYDESPVMHLSFHGQLGKKYAISYRSYNGAPELKVSKNEDDDIVIDVQKKNMSAFETALWVSPALQLPFIRMHITLGYKGLRAKAMGMVKPGEVTKNMSPEEVLEDKADEANNYLLRTVMSGDRASSWEYYNLASTTKKRAEQAGLNYKTMSEEEKAALMYYTLRFNKMMAFDINNMERAINSGYYTFNGLANILNASLWAMDILPSVMVSNYRTGISMKEVMEEDDLRITTTLPGNKFLSIESIYDIPFETPADIEGISTGRVFGIQKKRNSSRAALSAPVKVPASQAVKNAHIEKLKLTIDGDNTLLNVDREAVIKGHYKYDIQRALILYEDFYEAERKALFEKQSLIEVLEDSKKGKKYVDEVKNAFAEARKEQKTAFEQDAKGWFEQEVSDMKNIEIKSMGVRHTSPDLIYTSSFKMDGLLKKAGNNLIFEVGKIQGNPLSVKEEQRKRGLDIYMPFARSVEYHLEIAIPEGFTAEGVDALNKNVANETGFFKTEASTDGKLIKVSIKKHYLNGYESANNWPKLLEFIDASNDWTNAKILFKKK